MENNKDNFNNRNNNGINLSNLFDLRKMSGALRI